MTRLKIAYQNVIGHVHKDWEVYLLGVITALFLCVLVWLVRQCVDLASSEWLSACKTYQSVMREIVFCSKVFNI